MCGIVGYVGHKNATEVLISGLKRLEYRVTIPRGSPFWMGILLSEKRKARSPISSVR